MDNSDPLGVEGTKTFEVIVTPQNTDVRELPPISFSFFNPDDGKYHTLTQSAVPLVVKAAGARRRRRWPRTKIPRRKTRRRKTFCPSRTASEPSRYDGPAARCPAGVSRHPIRARPRISRRVYLAQTHGQPGEQSAPAPPARRGELVTTAWAIEKIRRANQPDEFFATLFRLLQEQLGERLDCPASAITENVIDEHPALRGAPEATLDSLRELFQLCNQARYAPVRGTSELNSVAAQFEKPSANFRRWGREKSISQY